MERKPSTKNPPQEQLPAMTHTLRYLAEIHAKIRTDHRDSHFGVLAERVAKQLIKDGYKPHIERVYEETRGDGGLAKITKLIPVAYTETMTTPWHAHNVCCTEDLAFDPILGRPVPKKDYTKLVFGKDIAMIMGDTYEELKTKFAFDV